MNTIRSLLTLLIASMANMNNTNQPSPEKIANMVTISDTTRPSAEQIAAWPKVELHLHLDCSISYEAVKAIAPGTTPASFTDSFVAPDRCKDLKDYIAKASHEIDLMQTREQLRIVTLDLFRQLAADNVIYAEIRFAPLQHLKKGLTAEQVVAAVNDAVTEGIQKTGIQMGVILCTLRHYSKEQGMETVKLEEKFGGTHVVGFDIAADEAGFPLDNNIGAFQYAHTHGIHCTAHAGEAAGPKSVWETLDRLDPERIGHGVRSSEDTALVARLVKQNIHLEVCPTSNLQTNIYADIKDHPIDRLRKAGVSLGINTDGRTISNTNLNKEYTRVAETFHWTASDFLACNKAALEHAFTSPENKRKLLQLLEEGYKMKKPRG